MDDSNASSPHGQASVEEAHEVDGTVSLEVPRSIPGPAPTVETSVVPLVVIRLGTHDDHALFTTAFLRHYPGNVKGVESYCAGASRAVLRAKLEPLLDSSRWRLLVACPSHEPSEIMGCILYRPSTAVGKPSRNVVAWLTVKPEWQGRGVAKALIKAAGIDLSKPVECAFLHPAFQAEALRKGIMLKFRPYLPDMELFKQLEEKANQEASNGKG